MELSGGSSGSGSSSTKDLDKVALRMLLFPVMFVANNLLYIIFRLADIDGKRYSDSFLAVSCSIYALSGFCDTLLYGLTRKVISLPITHSLTGSMPRSSHSQRQQGKPPSRIALHSIQNIQRDQLHASPSPSGSYKEGAEDFSRDIEEGPGGRSQVPMTHYHVTQ